MWTFMIILIYYIWHRRYAHLNASICIKLLNKYRKSGIFIFCLCVCVHACVHVFHICRHSAHLSAAFYELCLLARCENKPFLLVNGTWGCTPSSLFAWRNKRQYCRRYKVWVKAGIAPVQSLVRGQQTEPLRWCPPTLRFLQPGWHWEYACWSSLCAGAPRGCCSSPRYP